jgi:demethylmenaquinone methyltransferase/2-methoxy-6-polyprenyl-1,4-benzoquinol methylase
MDYVEKTVCFDQRCFMNIAKAEFFDSQVDEPWASSAFGPGEMAKIERMLRQANLSEGMRVIEPGCGTGRLTTILAERVGPTGFVLALDISPKMICAARSGMALRDNASLRCAAIEDCPLDPEGFDVVVCHSVLPHFDNKLTAVAHMASALKKGGKFIVFHFMNSACVNDLHRKAHPTVMDDFLPTETKMREILEAAGLQVDLLSDDDSGYLLSATRT